MKAQYPSRLMLPSEDGYTFYEIDKIIRCEAKDNQTLFYIISESNDTKLVHTDSFPVVRMFTACVPIPLKKYETTLADTFCKVHKDHLINLNHVSKYFQNEQGFVLMTDGSRVEVADIRKEELIKKLKDMVII